MWGSRRNNITLIEQDTSSTTTTTTSHHRRNSSSCFYYVQSPVTEDDDEEGNGRVLLPSNGSMRSSSVMRWGHDEREYTENIELQDNVPQAYHRVEHMHTSENEYDIGRSNCCHVALKVLAVLLAVVVIWLLVLWGICRMYKPYILVQDITFTELDIHQGLDRTGVATEVMSLNSTVRVMYTKPFTHCSVHISSSPFILRHYGINLASGQMEDLYRSEKNEESITTKVVIQADETPLYGAPLDLQLRGAKLDDMAAVDIARVKIEMNLTSTIYSKCSILGKLVWHKSFKSFRCPFTIDGVQLHNPIVLKKYCVDE